MEADYLRMQSTGCLQIRRISDRDTGMGLRRLVCCAWIKEKTKDERDVTKS